MPRVGGFGVGPFNPNDFNFRSGGAARGTTGTYNFVRGSQGWISCCVVVFDVVTILDEWWTQFKFRGAAFSAQEVGTAGYAHGDGGLMNLEVYPVAANGLPSFTSTGTRLAKQLAVEANDLWDAQTGAFGGGDGPGPVLFTPRNDANGMVTFQPDTPYGFCLYNSRSTPADDFSSQQRANTRDLFWGPNTPPLGGTAWPAAQISGSRFRPPHHVLTLDKNAPGAIAGLDPRERWMASYDGGTTWRVGLNANYYSGAADPSNDGPGLPIYMVKASGGSLRKGQPYYNSHGTTGLATGAQSFTAVTTQTVTHAMAYSPNAVSSITVVAPAGTRTATGGSLGTSGGQAGPLNSPLVITSGQTYTVTPNAGVIQVDADTNTALFGVSTDDKGVSVFPNPQFGAVGTPVTPPPTSVVLKDLNGGASLTGSGITLGEAPIIPSVPDHTSVLMGSGVASHPTRHAFDARTPFTFAVTGEFAAGTGRVLQKLQNPDLGTENGYAVYRDGSGIGFARVVNGAYVVARDNSAPTSTAFYHFVYDGSTSVIYRNGVAGTAVADARSIATFPTDGSAPFVFGGKADATAKLGGHRQILTVVPRALSASEVAAAYVGWQGTGQPGSSVLWSTDGGLYPERLTAGSAVDGAQNLAEVVSPVAPGATKSLRVTLPAGTWSTSQGRSGAATKVPFTNITVPGTFTNGLMNVQTQLYFGPGFSWGTSGATNGKLFGFEGGVAQSGQGYTQYISARFVWEGIATGTPNKVKIYAYHYGMTDTFGTYFPCLDTQGNQLTWPTGTWVDAQIQVKLNTPGQSDGVLRTWINGVLALDVTNHTWRGPGETGVVFQRVHAPEIFHGGGSPNYAPVTTSFVYTGPFNVSDAFIGAGGGGTAGGGSSAAPTTPVLDTLTGRTEDPLSNSGQWVGPIEASGTAALNLTTTGATGRATSPNWCESSILATYTANQECYCTVPVQAGTVSLDVRLTGIGTSALSGYHVEFGSGGTFQIMRIDNGAYVNLGAAVAFTRTANDQYWFFVIGSTITVAQRANGVSTWSVLATRTDTAHVGAGRIGLEVNGNTARVTKFGGGSI